MNDLPQLPYPITLKGAMLEECDLPRLNTLTRAVWDIMADGLFHELNEIAYRLGKPHSSITASVRSFRYPENGGHIVHTIRKEAEKGTWLYRLEIVSPEEVKLNKARAKAVKRHSHDAFNSGRSSALIDVRKEATARSTLSDIGDRYIYMDDLNAIINDLMPGEDHE